jgi:hypothetical protein
MERFRHVGCFRFLGGRQESSQSAPRVDWFDNCATSALCRVPAFHSSSTSTDSHPSPRLDLSLFFPTFSFPPPAWLQKCPHSMSLAGESSLSPPLWVISFHFIHFRNLSMQLS